VVSLLRPGGGLFAPVSGGHFDRFFQLDSIYLAKRVLPKMEGISVNKFYLLKMELKLLKLTNKTLT